MNLFLLLLLFHFQRFNTILSLKQPVYDPLRRRVVCVREKWRETLNFRISESVIIFFFFLIRINFVTFSPGLYSTSRTLTDPSWILVKKKNESSFLNGKTFFFVRPLRTRVLETILSGKIFQPNIDWRPFVVTAKRKGAYTKDQYAAVAWVTKLQISARDRHLYNYLLYSAPRTFCRTLIFEIP